MMSTFCRFLPARTSKQFWARRSRPAKTKRGEFEDSCTVG
jgi:hypothetical protein